MPRGTVVEFDAHKGYGTARDEDGNEYFFHCTQIADGSRTIDPDADVSFEVAPGPRGQWEAVALTRRAGSARTPSGSG